MKQGKLTVAQFAQKFQDIGSQTGFSNADLMERFCSRLNPSVRLHMVSINIAQGKPKSLSQAVSWALEIELALHDPTYNSTSNHRSDPNAMDIDATRVGNGGGGRGGNWNGKTRDDFLQKMKGRCFGCGSDDHIKSACSWKTEKCRYCARTGHVERVCQDKFLGVERGRDNRTRRGGGGGTAQWVAANTPFSLFDDETPALNTTPSPSIAASSTPNLSDELQGFRNAMAEQNKILAAILQKQEDF